jgi:hypothetical protein
MPNEVSAFESAGSRTLTFAVALITKINPHFYLLMSSTVVVFISNIRGQRLATEMDASGTT